MSIEGCNCIPGDGISTYRRDGYVYPSAIQVLAGDNVLGMVVRFRMRRVLDLRSLEVEMRIDGTVFDRLTFRAS